MASLFLSHSSADNAAVEELRRWLLERRYDAFFLDFDPINGIPGGRNWERELYLQLRANDAVIALWSKAYQQSSWCFAEVAQARALNKTIIPVKIEDSDGNHPQPDSVEGRLATSLKKLLSDLQIVDFRGHESQRYERLEVALRAAGLDPVNSFRWDGTRPPYPGLNVFESDDAAVFFGRDQEIQSILGLLAAGRTKQCPRLVVVAGPSGSGKSSLVRGGVLPRLDSRQWHIFPPLRPGRSPIASLVRSFAAYNAPGYVPPDPAALLELLPNNGAIAHHLIDAAAPLAHSEGGHAAILLVVDQWEELFGSASEQTESDRVAFHAVLRQLVEAARLPLVVLATLRSDFFDTFQSHKGWIGLRREAWDMYPLKPMPPDRFTQVVEGPSSRGRVILDQALIARLVQDAKNSDALPLLAFALRRLYDCREADGRMTLAAYEKVGGIQGALGLAVQEAMGGDLTPCDEAALRRAFVRDLVHIDRKGPYLRQRARWDHLPTVAHPRLERFVEARLLTVSVEDGNRMVEVVHETLFTAWDQLAGWLNEGRALRLWRDRVEEDRAAWAAAPQEQRPQRLLTGARVAEARRWLEDSAEYFEPDQQKYLEESIAADRRGIRNRRFAKAAVGLLFLGLAAVGVFAFLAEQDRKAEAQNRKAEAQNHRLTRLAKTRLLQDAALDRERRGDPGTSAVLLGHALVEAEGQDSDLESALRVGITLARGRLLPLRNILAVSGAVRGCAISPDGTLAVVGSDQGGVLFVDPASGQLTTMAGKSLYRTGSAPTDLVTGVTFAPDGRRFAVCTNGGKVHVVDTRTGEARIISHEGRPMSACFSRDGSDLLVAGWLDAKRHAQPKALVLYSANTGVIKRTFPIGYDLYTAAICPDNRWIAAGGGMPPNPRLTVWDLSAPETPGRELPQPARVFTLAFRPAHLGEFVTGDVNGVVRFWQLRRSDGGPDDRQKEMWQTRGQEIPHDKQVRVTAFTEDGRLLLVGGEDNTARLWDAQARAPIGQRLEHRGRVYAGAVSTRARRIIAGDFAGDIRIFDLQTSAPADLVLRHPGPVRDASFSPEGDRVLTGFDSSPDGPGGARVWDVAGGPPVELPHGADILNALYRPQRADRALTFGNDGSIAYWDTRTGQRLRTYQSPQRNLIYSAAVHPTGDRFAYAESGEAVIHVCSFDDLASDFRFTSRFEYQKKPAFIWNLRFTADGRLLSDGGFGFRIWPSQAEAKSPLAEMSLPEGSPSEAAKADRWLGAVDRDDRRVVVLGADGSIAIWHLTDPQARPRRIGNVPHGSGQLVADWHGASDVIATGGPNGRVRLWQPDGTQLADELIHPSPIEVVKFSPDGQWLATGGRDGGMRLWKVASGVWTGAGWYHAKPVTRVRFSSDGRYLLSASMDGTARVVPVPVETTGKPDRILADLQADSGVSVEVKGTGAAAAATAPRPLTATEHRALRGALPW